MNRQSISFTGANQQWMNSQIESQEYSSKSELINDLVRQARHQHRQLDWISSKLDKAENSGFTNDTQAEILAQSKTRQHDKI